MDARNPAPREKPWNDMIPLYMPTKNGFPWFQGRAKRISSIHSMNLEPAKALRRTSSGCGSKIGNLMEPW